MECGIGKFSYFSGFCIYIDTGVRFESGIFIGSYRFHDGLDRFYSFHPNKKVGSGSDCIFVAGNNTDSRAGINFLF